MFIGSNDLGQTGPSYVSKPDCGFFEPSDQARAGFPNSHTIMVVTGMDESPDVPATTVHGIALTLPLMLGVGAYALHRVPRRSS